MIKDKKITILTIKEIISLCGILIFIIDIKNAQHKIIYEITAKIILISNKSNKS